MSDHYSIIVRYNVLATFEATLFVTWCNLVDIATNYYIARVCKIIFCKIVCIFVLLVYYTLCMCLLCMLSVFCCGEEEQV